MFLYSALYIPAPLESKTPPSSFNTGKETENNPYKCSPGRNCHIRQKEESIKIEKKSQDELLEL